MERNAREKPTMLCNEWSNLLKRYQHSVHAYDEAMNRLSAEFGTGFTTAWQQAETARRRSSDCRNALLTHQRYHGCVEHPMIPQFFTAAAGGGTEDMVLGDQGQAGG
jgi:hypothetical protein